MTSPEATTGITATALAPEPGAVNGWGGGPRAPVELVRPTDLESLSATVAGWRGQRVGAIARGLGRSYGDAAQLHSGLVIDMTRLRAFDLDPAAGVVTAQAGVMIAELLDALVPRGWIVPVVPGTQYVTVGGAIASDIHGKNHGTAGTFGSHVEALGLLRANGELIELAPGAEDRLFEATLGGMGLTGVIVWARIALRRVDGSTLSVDTDRAAGLEQALALLAEPGGAHRVAWLDLLGRKRGRGIVTRADHIGGGAERPSHGQAAGEDPAALARDPAPSPRRGGVQRVPLPHLAASRARTGAGLRQPHVPP